MVDNNISSHNDQGVSVVIGVILMVAIAIILAAIIATFSLGMFGNSVSEKKTPVFSPMRIGNNMIQITLIDKGGALTLSGFKITQPSDVTITYTKINGAWDHLSTTTSGQLEIGDTIEIQSSGDVLDGSRTVHLVCTSNVDGATQVVMDTYI